MRLPLQLLREAKLRGETLLLPLRLLARAAHCLVPRRSDLLQGEQQPHVHAVWVYTCGVGVHAVWVCMQCGCGCAMWGVCVQSGCAIECRQAHAHTLSASSSRVVHACCCTRHRSSSAPRSAQCRCTCRTSSASALSYASICRRRSTAASPSSASSDDANIITSEREEGVKRLRATSRPSFDSLGHCTPPPTTALKSGSPPRGCMHLGTLAPDISSAACAIDAAKLGWRKGASSGAPPLSGGTCCRRVRSWSCDHTGQRRSQSTGHGDRHG